MVEYIPFPDPRSLLPPLLACLATAFSSARPPPALLPLLSPILRQRVQIHTSLASSAPESWLKLLCWDAAKAERVQNIVESNTFEPHPSSGEIEISDDVPVRYKRLDQETLRSKLPLSEFNLTALYLWCPTDQEGGGPGWRLAELLPADSLVEEEATWSESIGEANESRQQRIVEEALREADKQPNRASKGPTPHIHKTREDEEEVDDDDYWAQYDRTPGRTPLPKKSPAPASRLHGTESDEDDSYFDRYDDIQPEMDNDDPSADKNGVGDSSLNGDTIASILQRQAESVNVEHPPADNPWTTNGHNGPSIPLNHPRPSSASSTGSDAVSRLEQTAEAHSASEIGVKQHISSNIKSLFRLAKSAGIPTTEFYSIVRRELDMLSLVDGDEEY